jgi:transcriptional regulator with XRE-family HTH domain
VSLGQRLADARRALGLQQKQLGEKAGVSPSLVSQIERGRVSASLATLRKLAGVLGVPLAHFFDDRQEDRIRVIRKADHARLSFDGASERWTILASGLVRGKIRAVVATLGARQASAAGDKIVVEPGEMKLCYVMQGTIDIVYGGQTHRLESGDSAYLDGGVDHRWANPGTKTAKVLWVITERRR